MIGLNVLRLKIDQQVIDLPYDTSYDTRLGDNE